MELRDNVSLGELSEETFHRVGMFVDGPERLEMDAMIDRFFQALFGSAPTLCDRSELECTRLKIQKPQL